MDFNKRKSGSTGITNNNQSLQMASTHDHLSRLKSAQDSQEGSADQLRYMLESCPAAVRIASSKHAKLRYTNARYSELVNTKRDAVIGANPRNYYLSSDEYDEILLALSTEGSISNRLVKLKIPDHGIKYVLASYLNTYFEDELCMVGWFMDVTQLMEAEQSVRLQASVFDNAREGILITDANNQIISVNQAFTTITGYQEHEVLGANPSALSAGRQSPAFYENMWSIIKREGYWRGEVWNKRKTGEVYPELLTITQVNDSHGNLLHHLGIFSDISETKQHEQILENMAHYDPLTRLPNRMLLAMRMDQAIATAHRNNTMLAICFMDLDGFKPINDQYGHQLGDKLLVKTAETLESCVRADDTVARLGGDEFVLLLNNVTTIEGLNNLICRILHRVSQPVTIESNILSVSASIGVTIYPNDKEDADTLIRHADMAMYEAKQEGRNCYHLFDTKLESERQSRQSKLDRLQEALVKGEFRLYYQPQVNLVNGDVVGVEALIRWQHPEKGILGPLAFLPLIENHPLIIEIGDWVILRALQQLQEWQDANLHLKMSVNVAALQLQDRQFSERLHKVMAKFPKISGQSLELEIIETSALQTDHAAALVAELSSSLGVTFALDDFGTGYSSLSYLKELPASTLKVDQSFVRDMLIDKEDRAIVEGVIGLAKIFKRTVVAEGVESQAHAIELTKMGCEIAQGYGISKPMPAEEVANWVEQYRQKYPVSFQSASI